MSRHENIGRNRGSAPQWSRVIPEELGGSASAPSARKQHPDLDMRANVGEQQAIEVQEDQRADPIPIPSSCSKVGIHDDEECGGGESVKDRPIMQTHTTQENEMRESGPGMAAEALNLPRSSSSELDAADRGPPNEARASTGVSRDSGSSVAASPAVRMMPKLTMPKLAQLPLPQVGVAPGVAAGLPGSAKSSSRSGLHGSATSSPRFRAPKLKPIQRPAIGLPAAAAPTPSMPSSSGGAAPPPSSAASSSSAMQSSNQQWTRAKVSISRDRLSEFDATAAGLPPFLDSNSEHQVPVELVETSREGCVKTSNNSTNHRGRVHNNQDDGLPPAASPTVSEEEEKRKAPDHSTSCEHVDVGEQRSRMSRDAPDNPHVASFPRPPDSRNAAAEDAGSTMSCSQEAALAQGRNRAALPAAAAGVPVFLYSQDGGEQEDIPTTTMSAPSASSSKETKNGTTVNADDHIVKTSSTTTLQPDPTATSGPSSGGVAGGTSRRSGRGERKTWYDHMVEQQQAGTTTSTSTTNSAGGRPSGGSASTTLAQRSRPGDGSPVMSRSGPQLQLPSSSGAGSGGATTQLPLNGTSLPSSSSSSPRLLTSSSPRPPGSASARSNLTTPDDTTEHAAPATAKRVKCRIGGREDARVTPNMSSSDSNAAGGTTTTSAAAPSTSSSSQTKKLTPWQKVAMYGAYFMIATGNTIYFKKMTDTLANYSWFTTNITTIIFIPFFCTLTFLEDLAENNETPKQTIPKSKTAVMGLLDSCAGLAMVLGGAYTAGGTQVLLSQGAIPVTIALSVLLLRRSFHICQYAGAGIIVSGVVISKLNGQTHDAVGDNPTFNAIFASSNFPTALSTIYKEVAFQDIPDLSVNLIQLWVAIWQGVFNLVLCPVYTLKILGPSQIALDDMLPSFVNGAKCYWGIDTLIHDCDDGTFPRMQGVRPCDYCENAFRNTNTYVTFNILYNILCMCLVKYGTASFYFVINAVRLPMTTMLFASPLIMGATAVPMGLTDWFALFVVLFGLVVYKYGSRLKKRLDRARLNVLQDLERPLLPGRGPHQGTTAGGAREGDSLASLPEDSEDSLRRAFGGFVGPNIQVFDPASFEKDFAPQWMKTPIQIRAGYIQKLGLLPPGKPSPINSPKNPDAAPAAGTPAAGKGAITFDLTGVERVSP
ncbi:unnamed protein product [Amoebophrya sp. A25]|nr:unnamed protein product [Amoebophrya sp. A25]|eukprot:GSA25T00001017001.1